MVNCWDIVGYDGDISLYVHHHPHYLFVTISMMSSDEDVYNDANMPLYLYLRIYYLTITIDAICSEIISITTSQCGVQSTVNGALTVRSKVTLGDTDEQP